MFQYLICVTLFALATAAATIGMTEEKQFVPILNQGEEKNIDGSFSYYFEGADGGKREEVGLIKNPGTEEETLVVKGSYSYINADGEEVRVQYIADENGFQPQGTIIPKEISQAAFEAALRSSMEVKQQQNTKINYRN